MVDALAELSHLDDGENVKAPDVYKRGVNRMKTNILRIGLIIIGVLSYKSTLLVSDLPPLHS